MGTLSDAGTSGQVLGWSSSSADLAALAHPDTACSIVLASFQ